MNKPKVGDVLWCEPGINSRGQDGFLSPVTKVGRKYFTLNVAQTAGYVNDVQFHLDTFRQKTEYADDYKLYSDEQEYRDHAEAIRLHSAIRDQFTSFRATNFMLGQLRQVAKILGMNKEQGDSDE